MRIKAERTPYHTGMLLEAGMLNRDFALTHFLIEEYAFGKFSDGIISGLPVIARDGGLFLQKGVFKLNGRAGWLLEEMALEMPPERQTSYLCLSEESENTWQLEWKKSPANSLTLCRTKLSEPAILRNSFHLSSGTIPALENWQTYLNGPDYIQLEYAMAASHGAKPTLLPVLQRALAPFAKPKELKIWLINGLFPFMDYFCASSWQEGLDKLIESFTEGEIKTISSAPKKKSILSR